MRLATRMEKLPPKYQFAVCVCVCVKCKKKNLHLISRIVVITPGKHKKLGPKKCNTNATAQWDETGVH